MRAQGDPEELVRFANALQHYLDTLQQETQRLNGAFSQLGDTWKDQKRAAFENQYRKLQGSIHAFHEQASQEVPYLRQLAARLQDYLRT